jgi:hypothetical protein
MFPGSSDFSMPEWFLRDSMVETNCCRCKQFNGGVLGAGQITGGAGRGAVRVKNSESEIANAGDGKVAAVQPPLTGERRCRRPRSRRQEQKRRPVTIELHGREFIITAYFNKLQ